MGISVKLSAAGIGARAGVVSLLHQRHARNSVFFHLHADDTKIGRAVSNIEDNRRLQADLDRVQEWSDKWQLRFNSSKCKVIHLGYNNSKAVYSMNCNGSKVVLESSAEEKDLGVWIDDKLKFASHVGHVVAKSNQILGLIKRSFQYKEADMVKKLFTALVHPHLEYANVVWHPRFKKEIVQIERVQRTETLRMRIDFSSWTYRPWCIDVTAET